MTRSTTCGRCGARQSAGSRYCALCEARLGAPAVLDALPADEEEELVGTVVEDEAEQTDPPLSAATRGLTKSHRLTHLNPSQRVVYALLARTLQEYRGDLVVLVLGLLAVPVLLLLGVGLSVAVTWGLSWLARLAGDWVLYAPVAVFVLAARALKSSAEESAFKAELHEGRMDHWRLGRLKDIFHVGEPASLALYFGGCFGFQWGLLAGTSSNAGLDLGAGWGQCLLLTLDNLCHGIFFDFCELYDLNWGPKLKHTTWSATVFSTFRLTYDALVVLFVYVLYQRFRLRRLMWYVPNDPRSFGDVMAWLQYTCSSREQIPARYTDEMLFLILVKEYLAGRFALVRGMSEQFGWLKVDPAVRRLFRDNAGKVVFEGTDGPV